MKKCLLSILLAGCIVTVACAGENVAPQTSEQPVAVQNDVPAPKNDFKQVNHIQVPATNIASPMDVNVILPESYATSNDKK